jgi:LmbE family N-acetylglucosaminyl deacetylase
MRVVMPPGWFGNRARHTARFRLRSRRSLPLAMLPAPWRVAAMVDVRLGSAERPLRRILCLGAHCDDIEIGCGGTILRLLRENPEIEIYWKVFSSTPVRKREALHAASLFLAPAKKKKVVILNYQDGFFPSLHAQIKGEFEKLKNKFLPDLILTHYRHDLHQDHRTLCELTWNTYRNHLILEYEIPKYDGDLGSPNLFVDLKESVCRAKLGYLRKAFASQQKKHWFTEEVFSALMRLRGVEAGSSTRFAEAFYARKIRF